MVVVAESQWQVSTIGIWRKGNKKQSNTMRIYPQPKLNKTKSPLLLGCSHHLTHYTTYTASSNAAMGKVP